MRRYLIVWVAFSICLAAMVATASGCNLFDQHARIIDSMRGAVQETAQRLGDSSVAQIQAGGHVNNPGIRVAAGVEYFADVHYLGIDGSVSASASGQLDREITPAERDLIATAFNDASISDAQRTEAIREVLTAIAKRIAAKAAASQPSK